MERITAYADHAIEFSRKNAYDIIAGARTDYPLIFACRYFSTPAQGGFALIYAYELTKKPVYLAAAVQGANYSLARTRTISVTARASGITRSTSISSSMRRSPASCRM